MSFKHTFLVKSMNWHLNFLDIIIMPIVVIIVNQISSYKIPVPCWERIVAVGL